MTELYAAAKAVLQNATVHGNPDDGDWLVEGPVLRLLQRAVEDADRARQLELVLEALGHPNDDGMCWCAEARPHEHDEWCMKARAAMGVEPACRPPEARQ